MKLGAGREQATIDRPLETQSRRRGGFKQRSLTASRCAVGISDETRTCGDISTGRRLANESDPPVTLSCKERGRGEVRGVAGVPARRGCAENVFA
jgi:hypothetical protein